MEWLLKLAQLLGALMPLIFSTVKVMEKEMPECSGAEKKSAAMSHIEGAAQALGAAGEELVAIRPAVEGIIASAVRVYHEIGEFVRSGEAETLTDFQAHGESAAVVDKPAEHAVTDPAAGAPAADLG